MPRRPNILFFFTDDQRFDTIHALGCRDIHTPNIDALADRGVTFTNAYIMGGTSGAVCMPSRAMLHTGRTLFHLQEQGQDIPCEHVMLGECLRAGGYETFATGKWHNGPAAFARSFSCGGKIFFGGMSEHFHVPLNDFDPEGLYPADRIYHEPKLHSSDIFCGQAARFLRERKRGDKPFFAYVSFTAPHDPRDTHPRFHAMYDATKIPPPDNLMPAHPFDNGELRIRDELLAPFPRTADVIRGHLADYYAMISHLDDQIGTVCRTLEEAGEWENTIVVFAGDNGLALGRHGLMGKQSVYDHSVHVPLIFAGPGIPRGRTSEAFCYLNDIFPTLCDLTGVPAPASVEGRSLGPCLRASSATVRDTLLYAYLDLHRGVRDERWKLIEYVVNGQRTTQLFDLREDPLELKNLAEAQGTRGHRERLSRELTKWREMGDTGDRFWQALESGAG